MSPLTKMFVVLLVILSVAFVSGTIVALNQVTVNQTAVDAAGKSLAAERLKTGELQEQLEAEKRMAMASASASQNQIEDLQKSGNAMQMQLNDSRAQLADAASRAAIQSSDITRMTEALKTSEDTKSKYADQIADLRKTNDTYLTQTGQLNQAVTELTNRLDVAERERKYLAEQLVESKSNSSKMSAFIKDNGLTYNSTSAGTLGGAPQIDAVIRDTRSIAGIPYATISVGSNAQVTKGMEFSLVGANGDFLGKLTVDSVQPDEATGRISGPKVQQVQPGVEAKTQL